MTPAQRERFIIDVNEALSDQKVATLGAWLQERAETQARDLEDAKTEVLQLKRDITLRCLRVHKISCSPDNLARLEACTDSKTLTAWLERAYEATSEADVFG